MIKININLVWLTLNILSLHFTSIDITILQVKVFAWLPFGNQLFWFWETFLQIKSPASKF